MNCPYCGFHFGMFASNGTEFPDLVPLLCESCRSVGLIHYGVPRKCTSEELEEIKKSEAYKDFILPVIQGLEKLHSEKLGKGKDDASKERN